MTTNGLYAADGSVNVTVVDAGGVYAPASAKYITQTASSSLSAEQSLGLLTTGLLKNTVTAATGVLTTAVLGTDYGDVSGPASSTDNAIVTFNSTTGKILRGDGGGTLTGSLPYTISQTLNNSGVNFITFSINLSDSAGVNAGGGTVIQEWKRDGTRVLAIGRDGAVNAAATLLLSTAGVPRLSLTSTTLTAAGNLVFTDNTWDIGASGATRPKDLYLAGNATAGGTITSGGLITSGSSVQAATGTSLIFGSRSKMQSASDGNISLLNNAGSSFTSLQFGGTTSSFPAIKRNSAALNFRLADDSADAAFTAGLFTSSSTTLHATSAALTNGAAAQVGTLTNAPTAGNPTKWVPINDNGTTRYIPAW